MAWARQLLAGASLAEDENRRLRLRHLPGAAHHVAHGRSLRPLDRGGGVALDVALHQTGALALGAVKARERLALLRVLDGEAQDLAVDVDEVDSLFGVRLAHVPIEGHHAEAVLTGAQGHHHAGVAVGKVVEAVEGISLAVRVICLEECAGAPRIEGFADRGELREIEREVLHARIGERAPCDPRGELAVVEHEHDPEVVIDDP